MRPEGIVDIYKDYTTENWGSTSTDKVTAGPRSDVQLQDHNHFCNPLYGLHECWKCYYIYYYCYLTR